MTIGKLQQISSYLISSNFFELWGKLTFDRFADNVNTKTRNTDVQAQHKLMLFQSLGHGKILTSFLQFT